MSLNVSDKTFRVTLGTALTCALFIITSTVWFINNSESLSNRIDKLDYTSQNVTTILQRQDLRMQKLEDSDHRKDLTLTELTTRLQLIDATLIEIKTLLTKNR